MNAQTRSYGASDKLTFLLSLVPYLTDHDRVTVSEVAEHFGVPAARVRDAVSLIAMSGIPGETHQYLHGDLFDIQWDEFENNDTIVLTHLVAIDDSPRFSAREAAALIAGLQYLSSLPENADRDAVASLMAKLTLGASAAPSQLAVSQAESGDAMAIIQSAVKDGVSVAFDYVDAKGEHVHRLVDPLRIESVNNDWYLRGWCHLRRAVRTFRLDRISDLAATTESALGHPSDVVVPDALFEPSPEDLTVTVELPASALGLVADYVRDGSTTPVGDDRVRATLRVAHYHGLKRLVAGLAGVVTVVEPAEARQAVAEWAAAGADRYADAGDDLAPAAGRTE
ncbi:MAG TPA: WYL domain-containing protein [Glaciibacter sp.]|nr:WYL domain-containing protein [Glaciibacter sp.]